MLNSKALAASVSAPPAVYVEDVFSTFLYTGNGSTQTITNGIDLSGKGGLVWIKSRNNAVENALFDTTRGAGNILLSNTTDAQGTGYAQSFTSSGFSLANGGTFYNGSAYTYASWTFRKQAKFFDVVTYTGNGVSGRTVSHDLGSVPGCILIKRTDTTGTWFVYHRSTGNTGCLFLNTTDGFTTASDAWNNTTPTSSVFTLGNNGNVNQNTGTYVAYLFAHDAGGFGDSGSDSVIKCGSYTGNGSSTGPVIDLGWEPQWLLIKRTDNANSWFMLDIMRNMSLANVSYLLANLSSAESTTSEPWPIPTPTGFTFTTTNSNFNASSATYIYIAIRRGPMKTPTVGTSVFNATKTSSSSGTIITTNIAADLSIAKYLDGSDIPRWNDRPRGFANNVGNGAPLLRSSGTDAEVPGATGHIASVWNTGFKVTGTLGGLNSVYYSFRRAPGFFDVVAYTGTGSTRTVSHNLGVGPELMIIKERSASQHWSVYHKDLNAGGSAQQSGIYLSFDMEQFATGIGWWNNTAPTSSVFSTGNAFATNQSANTYIAYLFATLAGVSKVGSYTGTGTTKQIDCGFTAGARLVLIKRTDSTGNWYIWDTARGIISGNDPYLLLNSTAAEVTGTDYIDPLASGFEISSTAPAEINANGGGYIFLAIA